MTECEGEGGRVRRCCTPYLVQYLPHLHDECFSSVEAQLVVMVTGMYRINIKQKNDVSSHMSTI